MPVKKFQKSCPLEFESIQIDSINVQHATYCNECYTWKQHADIAKCACGGYLKPRTRFSTDTIEEWDGENRKDIV